MDVIGVGDADVDIFMEVDHIPDRDEKLVARRVALEPGGMVANFLVAVRRLGTACGFHGPVGDDEFGSLTVADMEANGVDASGTIVKAGERTYFCTVMLDESGEKSLVVAPTGCMFPAPEDVSAAEIRRARHLHTTAAVQTTTEKALRLAKQYGLTTSLDVEASAVTRNDDVMSLLSYTDLLFVNQRAATLLGDTTSLEQAATTIVSAGPQIVCITMGAAGALITNGDILIRSEAFSVDVVDSTGAGDCFAGGFVHGFLQGWSLRDIGMVASAVGAISVTQIGGHAGAPTFADVKAFLAARDVDTNFVPAQ